MQCIFHVHTHKTIIAAGTKEQLYIMIKIYIHSFIHEMLEVQPIYLKFPFFSCTAPQHEIDKPPVITGYLHIPPIIVSKERSFLLFPTISSSSTISSSLTSQSFIYTPNTYSNNYNFTIEHLLDSDIWRYDKWNDPCPSVMAYKSFSLIFSWNKQTKKVQKTFFQCFSVTVSMKTCARKPREFTFEE